MIRYIIFDYDGVIVDSFVNIHNIYKVIGKRLKIKIQDSIDEFRKIYGDDFRTCYSNLGLSKSQQLRGMEIFKEQLKKEQPKAFKGIKETLQVISKKFSLILVSSNYTDEVVNRLKEYDIEKYFKYIIGNTLDKASKFEDIVKEFHIKKDEVVVIGDRLSDYLAAKKVDMKNVILVEYGWGYDTSKFESNFYVNKPYDLINAINLFDK